MTSEPFDGNPGYPELAAGAPTRPGPPAPVKLPKPFRGRVLGAAGTFVVLVAYIFHKSIRQVGTGFYVPLLAGLIGGALVLSGPLVALSVYLGTTFFGAIALPSIPFSVNQAVGLIVLAAWGLWIVAGRTSWPGGRFVWLLVLSSIYYVLNAVLAEDREAGLEFAKYVALYELLGFVLLTSLRRPAHWVFWFWMILLFTTLSSLTGFVEFATQLDVFPGGRWKVVPLRLLRINGVSKNAIMFEYMSLFALGPGFYLALEERFAWRRVLAGFLTTFIVVTALLTLNRQAPLVLGAMLITAVALLRHRVMRTLTIGLVAVVLAASPYVAVKMGERLTKAGEAVKDPSYALRRDKLRIMREMVRQHPLTGIGLGSFPTVWGNYSPGDLWFMNFTKPHLHYPDMGYMQMLAESGLIGLSLDLVILSVSSVMLWKRRKQALAHGNRAVVNLCGVLGILLVHLIIKQLIQDVFFFPRSWWLFAMIVVASSSPDERLVDPSQSADITPSVPPSPADRVSPEGSPAPT